MKLMLNLALDYLQENDKATIKEIFDFVKSKQKVYWKQTFPNKLLSTIEVQKMGELFTYLTTDGRFVMVDSDHWSLAEKFEFDEVKKLKINMGTKADKE